MSTRTVRLFALWLLAGCAGPAYPAPSEPVVTRAGSDREAGPETDEARVDAALASLTTYCEEAPEACGAYFEPAYYPDVQLPEAERRFITQQQQEVRSLGLTLRWDSTARRIEVDRGNTLSFRGDPQSDPP